MQRYLWGGMEAFICVGRGWRMTLGLFLKHCPPDIFFLVTYFGFRWFVFWSFEIESLTDLKFFK